MSRPTLRAAARTRLLAVLLALGMVFEGAKDAYAGVDLIWNDCDPVGAFNRNFTCTGTINQTYRLVTQFQLQNEVTNFIGLQADIELVSTTPGPLAPFWHFETGGCQGGAVKGVTVHLDPSVLAECSSSYPDPWDGIAGGASNLIYNADCPSPGFGAFTVLIARTGGATTLSPGNYYAFDLDFKNNNRAICAGCSQGVALRIRRLELVRSAGSSVVLTDPDFGFGCVTINNASISFRSLFSNNCPCGHPSFTAYRDADGDGYGVPTPPIAACDSIPPGYVANNTDCDDTHASVHPGAPELCDGLDNDCDLQVDESPPETFAFTRYATEGHPSSVAIGDLNSDLSPDVAVANQDSGTVSVRLGLGDGTLGPESAPQVGAEPSSVAIGDLNGDGRPDLAVTNLNLATVSVLLGTGNGSFGSPTPFPVGSGPISVAIADLNADGKADLAVAGNTSAEVSVLLGTGGGSFGPKTGFAAGFNPVSVAIGDLNGDAKPDLALANSISPTGIVSVLLGTGSGSFGQRTVYSTGLNPFSLAIGDLNGDGKLDLAVANGNGPSVSVLLGIGDGTFGAKTDFGTGASPRSVTIGDLNADGFPDLATANHDANTMSVLLGNGNGTFGAKTDYCTDSQPVAIATAHLDTDGRRDLVVANMGSNTMQVVRNAGTFTVAVEPGREGARRGLEVFAPRPNPTSGNTTFAITIPEAARVRAEILDLAGRRVALLTEDAILPAGTHTLTWNGRSSSGARVANGVYFLRVSAGPRSSTRTLVMLSP